MSKPSGGTGSSGVFQESFLVRLHEKEVAISKGSLNCSIERFSSRPENDEDASRKITLRESESPSFSPPPVNHEGQDMDEGDLSCAICLDVFQRPKDLPCSHSFCLLCLQNYVSSEWTRFPCPTCRRLVELPSSGISGLPSNHSLEDAVKILDSHKASLSATQCGQCCSKIDVNRCLHCDQRLCSSCGSSHFLQISEDLNDVVDRLAKAKETLLWKHEENEIVEKRKRNYEELLSLTEAISHAMNSEKLPDAACEWKILSDVYSAHQKLLKRASVLAHLGVKFEDKSFSLPSSLDEPEEDWSLLVGEEEEDEKNFVPEDYSLFYRCKPSISRSRWGHNLGEHPAGLAVNPVTSEVYVTATSSCRIFVFDSSGKQLSSFGSRGHSEGQLLCPFGIAINMNSNEIFITDKWKHCVHVFGLEGTYKRQLGRRGRGFGHFSSPEGIATDRLGRIYVADTCNDRVQILDNDGAFLREVGIVSSEISRDGRRYTKSEFNEPTGVAVNRDGSRIYVADSGNHRVKVFSGATGERLSVFGTRGRHKGQFDCPECLAVDAEGFILVGDSGNGRVQIFRPNGSFVRYLGTRGNRRGEFGWVSGIALSKSMDIFITDFKNSVIAVF